jgi:hypothetical protein
MPRLRVLLILAATFALSPSCQSGDGSGDREECDRLVDHLVDIQLADDTAADSLHAGEHEKHRTILRNAIRERVVASCLEGPAAHTDCALRARTSAELKECD